MLDGSGSASVNGAYTETGRPARRGACRIGQESSRKMGKSRPRRDGLSLNSRRLTVPRRSRRDDSAEKGRNPRITGFPPFLQHCDGMHIALSRQRLS